MGNVMIDTLFRYRERARESDHPRRPRSRRPASYAALTLHRPSNVDDERRPRADDGGDRADPGGDPGGLPGASSHAARGSRRSTAGCRPAAGLRLVEPLPYLDFVQLMANARCVLTDSGGIQEETTALGVPCLTLRENTERPITVTPGHQPHRGCGPRRDLRGLARSRRRAAGRRASFPSSGTARRPSASSACSSGTGADQRRRLMEIRELDDRDGGLGRLRPQQPPRAARFT